LSNISDPTSPNQTHRSGGDGQDKSISGTFDNTSPTRTRWSNSIPLLRWMNPLLAQSGHQLLHCMTLCGNPFLRSLLGVKRTSLVAPHMSADDPSGHQAQKDKARTCKLSHTTQCRGMLSFRLL